MADDPAHEAGRILIGKSDVYQYLTLALGNRHGLVAGATGTGKTVSLQLLAEGFSRAGTAVFAADVKGDLAGIAMPGDAKPPLCAAGEGYRDHLCGGRFSGRLLGPLRAIGASQSAREFRIWDPCSWPACSNSTTFRKAFSTSLSNSPTNKACCSSISRICERSCSILADSASEVTKTYGNVAPATIGAIQRRLLVLENQGAAGFFGEPELDINDFLRCDRDGRGFVNIFSAEKLMRSPRLYAIFLLWMLSELFEKLPEVGDLEKPKLVFFFDEAHLLFDNAPKTLLNAIEQVVRLIRSKGVGIYFVTQNPADVPETVLGQLGNRVQHALRAFTPRDQKAVKAAADTFRRTRLRYRHRDHRSWRWAKPWSRCSMPRATPKSWQRV